MFCKDERPKVKAANPDYGVGDIAKELGKRWAEVEPSDKTKFEAQAEKDKARYDRVSVNNICLIQDKINLPTFFYGKHFFSFPKELESIGNCVWKERKKYKINQK